MNICSNSTIFCALIEKDVAAIKNKAYIISAMDALLIWLLIWSAAWPQPMAL